MADPAHMDMLVLPHRELVERIAQGRSQAGDVLPQEVQVPRPGEVFRAAAYEERVRDRVARVNRGDADLRSMLEPAA